MSEEFDIATWVAESCARQGVPEFIEDEYILARIAHIMSEDPAGMPMRGPLSSFDVPPIRRTTSARSIPPPVL